MLVQFQKEMWRRFTIQLVRLDSLGIQRIRSKIPTSHNPFFYYDKAIVFIDALKQNTEYRTHLEQAWWDVQKRHPAPGGNRVQAKTHPRGLMRRRAGRGKGVRRLLPIEIRQNQMLDYLLVRARDFALWSANDPETLRYQVIDELHTFDGAQGADLACLLRRLKARLSIPEGFLCCVGTSATLGGRAGRKRLIGYASEFFGESFDDDCVVQEHRLSAVEFLEKNLISGTSAPPPDKAALLDPKGYLDVSEYPFLDAVLVHQPEPGSVVGFVGFDDQLVFLRRCIFCGHREFPRLFELRNAAKQSKISAAPSPPRRRGRRRYRYKRVLRIAFDTNRTGPKVSNRADGP